MPSMPRLRTPDLSQITSPSVAKIKGQAILIVAAQNPAVKNISKNSKIICFALRNEICIG